MSDTPRTEILEHQVQCPYCRGIAPYRLRVCITPVAAYAGIGFEPVTLAACLSGGSVAGVAGYWRQWVISHAALLAVASLVSALIIYVIVRRIRKARAVTPLTTERRFTVRVRCKACSENFQVTIPVVVKARANDKIDLELTEG